MSNNSRKLVLNAFFQRFGHHPAGWLHPGSTDNGRPNLEWYIRAAKLAEAAKFHAFFLADFIGQSGEITANTGKSPNNYQFEPFTLQSVIASHTKHIGLVVTLNTNFNYPYNVARLFTSLDHISGGRAAWNVVAQWPEHTAENFGLQQNPPPHPERYIRAEEFLNVTKALWDTWDDDAFDHPNREARQFYDPAASHPLDFHGKYYASKGVLDFPRPIQGYPVIVQAGNSEEGREFAAKIAELQYCSAQSLDIAKAYYADVKRRLAKYGREEDDLRLTPGLSVVVAETDQEAQDRFGELQLQVDVGNVHFGGFDLSSYDVDGPLPDLPYQESENGKGRFRQQLELARRENLSIRELVLRFRVSRGHLQAIGSVKTVADIIEQWFVERAADGFNVVPPLLPSGFEDFTRLVVPELQRRGIFQTEYTGTTLREVLGFKRPANPNSGVSKSASIACAALTTDQAEAELLRATSSA
ncbi:LLM class flavin-dependent oxidoreductase [Candidatus Methylospira mobilis]|uniref:LLM class flavin-dependent oxidoreductase n=1 Tax=Candidatus Methylospira mobilis TaxID=1808979 RepID=A0A5Q0BKL2_9GAMM|nr:LLM class flavin-dependent oxidoreductase [Candidatus Methylospira mobilis]QFY42744.1 LLM class flavin-dependent oxidoreductase [Candidatus Methylospira mobilis]